MFFCLPIRRPPRSPRTDASVPYTTLLRSVFEGGEQHLAEGAAEHFGGQPVELDAVAARGGADDRGEQRFVEADARAAGRGDGEGFGPDMADRLDHQPIAPRRGDLAPAAFQFGHRIALAPAETGRAPGREREWKYVWITVVDRSFKK